MGADALSALTALSAFVRSVYEHPGERRAKRLLKRLLTPQQLHQLYHEGGIRVRSRVASKVVYKIPITGRVEVYLGRKHIDSLCIVSRYEFSIPPSDLVLARLLHLRNDEVGFVRTGRSSGTYAALRLVTEASRRAA